MPKASSKQRGQTAEARLSELNLQLPPAPTPMGVYKPVIVVGNLAYVSGHGPLKADGSFMTGRVGLEVDIEYAKAAARQAGLTILASLRRALGSLDKVDRIVKTFGLVNCTDDFTEHPKVINGCSELFVEIWGEERGIGARSAVGTHSLPANITVEIEVIFALS
ncbi:MAG TPA: RidA family protein [Verrucomicrobiae bacterium]|nr:RidA family protein [Verrucomicrobiae bacterium]